MTLNLEGKKKSFIYCNLSLHLDEGCPKAYRHLPEELENENILLKEDFFTVVVRHHAVDRTYQHGSLITNQVMPHG